ncbi:progranulin isoform X3 [Cuculus canorus]|uniref:progranulin isoform X3 n=1 Tax=Cuculus canorus TaxID=55661 RepID=UPI0023AB38DA|nr:progranulin isoform X3 [Cuculus canorus]
MLEFAGRYCGHWAYWNFLGGTCSAMTPLVPLLWLVLAGAWLPCPDAQLYPTTLVLPASSAAPCQDSSCPAGASCTLPEGVPCAGGHHCCPRGSHCSADGESCVVSPAPRAVPCPDGESECPDNATCCVTASGTWGCCPMPEASCCADKVHCCPHATICDLAHGRCLSPDGDVPLGTTFPAWKRQPPPPAVVLLQVLCPDGRSACPDGTTCCQLSLTEYGCCPLQNGTSCDLERSTCTSAPLRAALPKAQDVRCDEETSCPDGNTCCRLASGAWGCCPLEQAVCCEDHIHCCPQGSTCDPSGGTCLQGGGGRLPWLRKTPALARVGDVRCDEETSCPDGNTCCRLASGAWGCCPLEQAVCCEDHIHCCPQGSTCDPSGGTCLQGGGGRLPWLRKTPALARVGDVRCDEETSCPDGNTCCRLASGAWGCCPLEQAVCCGDHQHCCPRGFTCNVATESCEKLVAPTPLLLATNPPRGVRNPPLRAPTPLRATSTPSGDTVPCDATRSCRGHQRCCRSSGGSWGCCPFTQGSCCTNGRHCCPAGSRCTGGGWGCSPLRWDPPIPLRELL